ncbi:MAG TPA: PDZ domain-containing protein [Candidatus Polarisedimenticolia bacterium]|nr:PDZ domain-containing protein [Candidatus Polarisedimenticolia bacterium]
MTRSRIWGAAALAAVLVLAGTWFTVARAGDEGKKDVHKKVVIFRSGGSWLGVQIADVDMDRGKELGLRDVHGAEVQSVAPGSPAEEAGIKEGDVITEYQGSRIEGVAQLTRLVRETPSGRTARVEVWRNGSSKDLTVQMKEREHDGDDEDLPGHMQIWTDDDGDGKMTWFKAPTPPEPPDVNLEELEGLGDKLAMMGVAGGRPRLGVTVDTVGKQLADYFGVKQGSGVLVTSVGKGSVAESAGIKAGDVIVKVDDESVSDAGDLHMAMRHRRDKALTLTVVRERHETTVKVPAPPEDETPAPGTPSAHRPGAKPAEIQRQVERAMRDAQRAMRDSEQVRRDALASQRAAYAEAMRAVHEAAQLNNEQRQQIREAIQQALERVREQTGSIESPSDESGDAVRQGIEEGVEGGREDVEDSPEYDAPAADESDSGNTFVDSGHGTEEQRAEIRRAVEEARRIRLEGQSSDH